jgi:hypothetical protein
MAGRGGVDLYFGFGTTGAWLAGRCWGCTTQLLLPWAQERLVAGQGARDRTVVRPQAVMIGWRRRRRPVPGRSRCAGCGSSGRCWDGSKWLVSGSAAGRSPLTRILNGGRPHHFMAPSHQLARAAARAPRARARRRPAGCKRQAHGSTAADSPTPYAFRPGQDACRITLSHTPSNASQTRRS